MIIQGLHHRGFTWHGRAIDFPLLMVVSVRTKNVAKSIKKISCGTKKTEGKSWFVELSDKCKTNLRSCESPT